MNKSKTFLYPLTGVSRGDIMAKELIDSYLSDGTKDLGKGIYLLYSDAADEGLVQRLTSTPTFVASRTTPEGVMYEYTVSDEDYLNVVLPFLSGAYSRVDKTWVDKHFQAGPHSATRSVRMVFDKDPKARKHWEDKGLELPENAEV